MILDLHRRPVPEPMSIEKQRCLHCCERLTLRQIEPAGDGVDRRTYRCGKCHHANVSREIPQPLKRACYSHQAP